MKIGTNVEFLFKTLKLQNLCKMLGEKCKTEAPLFKTVLK